MVASDRDGLDQLAGITGLGWTASIIGYLGTAIGIGNTLVARVADPQSLFYLGVVLFATTFGLDRLHDKRSSDER